MRLSRSSRARALAAALCCALTAACSTSAPLVEREYPPPKLTARGTEIGRCSWYGPGFHGKPTASGEIYDQNAMTAAHRTLPLGTLVEVTDLASGRRVRVRVNDRGPYHAERVLDLSYGAVRWMNRRNVPEASNTWMRRLPRSAT